MAAPVESSDSLSSDVRVLSFERGLTSCGCGLGCGPAWTLPSPGLPSLVTCCCSSTQQGILLRNLFSRLFSLHLLNKW